DALPRDAVDDLVVDGDAHVRRVAVVAEEVRPRTGAVEDLPGDVVELGGGPPGYRSLPERRVDVGDDEAREAHDPDLLRGLVLDAFAHQLAFSAASRRSVTSSTAPIPSTRTSSPRSA